MVKKRKRVLEGTKDVISEIWEERSNGRCRLDPILHYHGAINRLARRKEKPVLFWHAKQYNPACTALVLYSYSYDRQI